MFDIPHFYQMDMSLEMATAIMRSTPGDTLLDAMEFMDAKWDLHCSGDTIYADDDEFYDDWMHEVNAYNVIKEHMKPLFVGD